MVVVSPFWCFRFTYGIKSRWRLSRSSSLERCSRLSQSTCILSSSLKPATSFSWLLWPWSGTSSIMDQPIWSWFKIWSVSTQRTFPTSMGWRPTQLSCTFSSTLYGPIHSLSNPPFIAISRFRPSKRLDLSWSNSSWWWLPLDRSCTLPSKS